MSKTAKFLSKVITGRVRFNYVHIAEPWAMAQGEETRFSLQILIRKTDNETLGKIHGAIEEAKKAGADLWGGAVPETLKIPLRDGDLEKLDYPELYAGHFFLNASTKMKPIVLDRQKKEIDSSEVYSGCYGRISLSLFPYSHLEEGNEVQRGIGCTLLNLQKISEGEQIGRTNPQEEFDMVEEEEIL